MTDCIATGRVVCQAGQQQTPQKLLVSRRAILRSILGSSLATMSAFFIRPLAAMPATGDELFEDPQALRLVLFNIGWEGIGHWQCECELSGLTLRGDPHNGT